jgi:2-(1,2-epoxy-1,2-dihydrophenyl)acetyl-CoA isomerase
MERELQPDEQPVLSRIIEDGVLELRLNRPQRMNAITAPMLAELKSCFDAAAQDEKVRVVILTGEGRGFCAGQDLGERDPRRHPWPFDLEKIQREQFQPVLAAMAALPKPVVVAVNGIASGAGAGIALAGDLVIAAAGASFAFSFVRVGLSSDAAVAWRLVKALGAARARALLMRGEAISAGDAVQAGLVWRSVPEAELDAVALETARDLAAGPAEALWLLKQVVQAASSDPLETYLETEARLQGNAGRSPDYREGVTAFLEKRPPRFSR